MTSVALTGGSSTNTASITFGKIFCHSIFSSITTIHKYLQSGLCWNATTCIRWLQSNACNKSISDLGGLQCSKLHIKCYVFKHECRQPGWKRRITTHASGEKS